MQVASFLRVSSSSDVVYSLQVQMRATIVNTSFVATGIFKITFAKLTFVFSLEAHCDKHG